MRCAGALWLVLLAQGVIAGQADVLQVEIRPAAAGSFDVDVTLRHDDTGWDHYANRWEVVSADGEIIATRVLAHPHVNEQPFTRSKGGIKLPEGTEKFVVRAHDSVHEYGGKELIVEISTNPD